MDDFITKTAQELVDAGEYANVEQASASLMHGIDQAKEQEKTVRKRIIDSMNRWQRRRVNKKAGKVIRDLQKNNMKPSEQFANLSERDQKKLLLKILERVHEENEKYEELKKNAENED